MYAELETLVNILCDADAMRDQGRLSAVRHKQPAGRPTTASDLTIPDPSKNTHRSKGLR